MDITSRTTSQSLVLSGGQFGHAPVDGIYRILEDGEQLEAKDGGYVLSQFTFAPTIHQHVHYHLANYDYSPDEPKDTVHVNDVPLSQAIVLVPLKSVLRCAGGLMIAFVFVCIVGNGTSAVVIINPLVALIFGVAGFGFFFMSFGYNRSDTPTASDKALAPYE